MRSDHPQAGLVMNSEPGSQVEGSNRFSAIATDLRRVLSREYHFVSVPRAF